MKRLVGIISMVLAVCFSVFSFVGCESGETKDENGNIINPIENHTVRFETNGGSEVYSEEVKVLSSAPYTWKSGYLFDGWYMDEDFKNPAMFPLELKYDITLYAKWLNLTAVQRCTDVALQMWTGYNSSATWYITPTQFDLETLAEKQYSMRITVDYNVYYKKDYDMWLDIGYAGSPKYEVYILDSAGRGKAQEDLPTTTSLKSKSITYTAKVANLIGEKLTLKFSTNNIQNIIYFKGITVTYECIK